MSETAFRAFLPDLVGIRHRLHQMPETGSEGGQTSAVTTLPGPDGRPLLGSACNVIFDSAVLEVSLRATDPDG